MTFQNKKSKELVCPICGGKIEFTGDSDYDCGGGLYYKGECKGCELDFNIYEDDDGYDLWYEG